MCTLVYVVVCQCSVVFGFEDYFVHFVACQCICCILVNFGELWVHVSDFGE